MISRLFSAALSVILLTGCEKEVSTEQNSNNTVNANQQNQIKERLLGYVKAINDRDADQAADFWSETAVYKNPVTGELVEGKAGIRKEMLEILAKTTEGATYKIIKTDIRFPTDNKAVVEGMAEVSQNNQEPIESPIKIIFVQEDGQWMLLHVSRLDLGRLNQQ